ncbi:MAG: DUF3445 domain-containing protein [Verrucomicrobia bacterium]|nr:DUF3445 domain-containing protein [Verrucomicrobiota bacterium]
MSLHAETALAFDLLRSVLAKPFRGFGLGLRVIDSGKFFGRLQGDSLTALRRALLDEQPEAYYVPLAGEPELLVRRFAERYDVEVRQHPTLELGAVWEPDYVVLEQAEPQVLLGGCVCFPSGWSLPEKRGRNIWETHAVVPGLNQAIGAQIARILSGLRANQAFQRINLGFSSSAELDQRPERNIPAIQPGFDPDTTQVRIEWQVLTALSEMYLLFGIRIFQLPLSVVKTDAELATALAEYQLALPQDLSEYKRLMPARSALVDYLQT